MPRFRNPPSLTPSTPARRPAQVIKLMQSLASRGLVRKSYTWNHHYFFLTNEGIVYLREYLSLPEMIVPNTHKKQAARPSTRPAGEGGALGACG